MSTSYKVTKKDFAKTGASECALRFIDFCLKHELWIDTSVYVDGKRYGCKGPDGHYHYDNTWDCVFCEDDINPKDYLDYAGTFMSVATEGPLYDMINYNCDSYTEACLDEMSDIFDDYGKYCESGNAWNFSLYNI